MVVEGAGHEQEHSDGHDGGGVVRGWPVGAPS